MMSSKINSYKLLEESRNRFLNRLEESDKKMLLEDKHGLLSNIANGYAWYLMGSPKKAGFYQHYHISSLYPIWKWAVLQIEKNNYTKNNILDKIDKEFEQGADDPDHYSDWKGICSFKSESSGCYWYDD